MFRTAFASRSSVIQPAGDPVKQLYRPVIREDGSFYLEEAGTADLYMEIQSHKDSVDIHVILDRFARGDVDALQRLQGNYMDITQMPTTYAELLNTVIQGETEFLNLPLEIREKFGHSYHRWIAGMDDMPSWMAAMGLQSSSAPSVDSSLSTPMVTPSAPLNGAVGANTGDQTTVSEGGSK